MKIPKSIIVGFILWLFAIGTIILVPLVKERVYNKGTYELMKRLDKYKAAFYALSQEDQEAVVKASKGLLILSDGKVHLIDESCENVKELVCMNIEYDIGPTDVEALIIQREKKSVKSQLPYVERMLIAHYKAALVRGEDGRFFLLAGRDAVVEYREKYKDDCPTCGEK